MVIVSETDFSSFSWECSSASLENLLIMYFCRPAGEFDQLNNCIYVNSATLSDRLFLTKHKHSLSAFVGSFEETKSKMSQLLKKRLGKYCWYGFEHIENKRTVLLITFHSHPCCQSLCSSWILEQNFFYLNQLKNMNRYCDKNSLPCCKVCLSLNCVCRKLSKKSFPSTGYMKAVG